MIDLRTLELALKSGIYRGIEGLRPAGLDDNVAVDALVITLAEFATESGFSPEDVLNRLRVALATHGASLGPRGDA